MSDLNPLRAASIVAVAVAAAALPSACGSETVEPDNAALDAHFNRIIADDEAERRRLVEEARTREEVRAKEMEERRLDKANAPD
jgi:hypothetical protein